jgi:hypothetical protein
MTQIRVKRDTLATMLRSHSEDDLAERAASLSEDELARIGTLGAYYAWSDDALALDGRGSMGGARALSLATIDVLEGTGRDLRRHRTDTELAWGWSEEPEVSERNRDRELRTSCCGEATTHSGQLNRKQPSHQDPALGRVSDRSESADSLTSPTDLLPRIFSGERKLPRRIGA